MAEFIEEFISIWNTYYDANTLPIQATDYDKFIIIVNKVKQKGKLEIEDTQIFIELVELMADAIYTHHNCADKYDTTYYQQTKIYEEPELNCCSNLLRHLESDLCWSLENKYDIAFAHNLF
jgi:hypothetical protein